MCCGGANRAEKMPDEGRFLQVRADKQGRVGVVVRKTSVDVSCHNLPATPGTGLFLKALKEEE